MKTTTFTSALVIACLLGTASVQAQHNENGRGGGARGNAYGHDKGSRGNQGGNGSVQSNRGGGQSNKGQGNAYGQSNNRGQGNAYGHDKNRGQGNAHGYDKNVNVRQNNQYNKTVNVNHTTVVNNRPVYRDNGRGARRNVVVTRPHRVHTINRIDNSYTRYRHGGYDYSYRDGHYYRHGGGVYTRCGAPYGLRIRVIPTHYNRIVIGAVPYFYFGGIFYRQYEREYEVVQPPVGAIVPELPEYGVSEVTINGEIYYEFDNVLYKPVVTRNGVQYRVVGNMDVNN